METTTCQVLKLGSQFWVEYCPGLQLAKRGFSRFVMDDEFSPGLAPGLTSFFPGL